MPLKYHSIDLRLNLMDGPQDIVFKMSEGNAGAINVLVQLLKINFQPIVQFNFCPIWNEYGSYAVARMDKLRIYGEQIWLLYKDVCGESLIHLIGVLRAEQLGLVSMPVIRIAMETYGEGIDANELLAKVENRDWPEKLSRDQEQASRYFELRKATGAKKI